jgi:hypothetical protein
VHTVGRWALRVPDGSDGPPNVPLWMDRLAVDLTDVAKDNQGTVAARPTSSTLTPGVSGRYFTTTDELDAGAARRRVYRDAGTAWDELATVPISDRQIGAAALTEAKMAAGATGLAKGSFSVYRSTNAATSVGPAVIVFDVESGNAGVWDASGWYDPVTGRFTPQLAGRFRLGAGAQFNPIAGASQTLELYKNGAVAKRLGSDGFVSGTIGLHLSGSATVEANGTTDFFDVRWSGSSANAPLGGAHLTYFQGELIGRV